MKRLLNLKRAPKDPRDKKYHLIAESHLTEPRKVDLRPFDIPRIDQGEIGECTGASWVGHFGFNVKKASSPSRLVPPYSAMFVYNCERIGDGTLSEDAGSDMRTGGNVLHDLGVCSEAMFRSKEANLYRNPSARAYALAAKNKCATFYAVDTVKEMRSCLITGYPFVFGFEVPNAFMDEPMSSTGRMDALSWATTTDGGHAVMCVGYDDDRQEWIVRNSWSEAWGDKGYFYLPYSHMTEEAFDHFTLRLAGK